MLWHRVFSAPLAGSAKELGVSCPPKSLAIKGFTLETLRTHHVLYTCLCQHKQFLNVFHSARWSRSTSRSRIMLTLWYDSWCVMNFTSRVILPQSYNPSLVMRNTADKSQLKDILQNTWPIFLKTVKVIQSKESLENCQSKRGAEGDIATKCNVASQTGDS